MSELSRSLVDAAMAQRVVAAVLETLAARTDAQKMMFDSAWLRRLAVETREDTP